MKKQITFFLLSLSILPLIIDPVSAQKNPDSRQFATLTNNTFSGIKIFRIDSSMLDQYAGKNQLQEGFHVIESIYSISTRGYIPIQRSYVHAEKGKTYNIKKIDCNYHDTIERCLYYNYPYIQITEKTSEREVGGMINKIKLKNDSISGKHLYPAIVSPPVELAHLSVNNGSDMYILSGRTVDEDYIVYFNPPRASSSEILDFYLRPGWYNYDYYFQDEFGTNSRSIYFRVKQNQTLVSNKQNRMICDDPGFVSLSETISLNDIQFLPDGKHGWIVGGRGFILATEDGGEHWKLPGKYRYLSGSIKDTSSDPLDFYYGLNCVFFMDSLNGWIGGDLGFLIQTHDGGKTWTRYETNTSRDIKEIRFNHTNEGFICFRNHTSGEFGLSVTNNGGKTWTGLNKDPYSRKYFLSKSIGIIKLTLNELSFSENNGSSWQKIMAIDPNRSELYKDYASYDFPRNCDFLNKDIGWILTNRNIFSTRDGGASWEQFKLPLTTNIWFDMVGRVFPGEPVSMAVIKFLDKNIGYCIGTEGCILHSKDGGATWISQQSHTNEVLTDIEFNGNQTWVIGNRGCILKSEDGGSNWKYHHVLDMIID